MNASKQNSVQSNDERLKMGLMKKPQGTVDEGETIANSPLRKMKSMEGTTTAILSPK
jgi:hypothetical protein